MFKKLEAWLSRIIFTVVSEVVRSERATREDARELLGATLDSFRNTTARAHAEERQAIKELHQKALDTLTGATSEILAEKNRLIADLHEKAADLQQSLSRFTQWTADEDTKQTDKLHQQVER